MTSKAVKTLDTGLFLKRPFLDEVHRLCFSARKLDVAVLVIMV